MGAQGADSPVGGEAERRSGGADWASNAADEPPLDRTISQLEYQLGTAESGGGGTDDASASELPLRRATSLLSESAERESFRDNSSRAVYAMNGAFFR